MMVTFTRVSGLPGLAYRPPPSCCAVLFEITRFSNNGWADPVICRAPPQPAGHAPPTTLPSAKVRPEIIVALLILAQVMVITRWLASARRRVVALLTPTKLRALYRVT